MLVIFVCKMSRNSPENKDYPQINDFVIFSTWGVSQYKDVVLAV